MEENIIGFDLDGVLCESFKNDKPYFKSSGEERKVLKKLRLNHYSTAKKIRNTHGKEVYIITGRKECVRSQTIEWLEKNGIFYHKLLMLSKARTRDNMIEFKKDMIEYYHIDTFYEDDPKIVRALTKKLPKVNIILVKNLTKDEKIVEKLKSFNN